MNVSLSIPLPYVQLIIEMKTTIFNKKVRSKIHYKLQTKHYTSKSILVDLPVLWV